MRQIILCRGIQGSGKSTWAKKWVLEDPEHRVRFNNDDVRNMLGKYWVPEREGLVASIRDNLIKRAMWSGYDIVIDNMNLNSREEGYFRRLIDSHNNPKGVTDNAYHEPYELVFKDFFIPLEECIARDALRPNPIGEKVIRETWNKYKHKIQTLAVENYVESRIEQNTTLPKCIILDMDSTLCFNTTKRPWYGPGSAEGMLNDIPNEPICELARVYKRAGYKIFIITGRDTSQEKVTEQWLYNNGVPCDYIYFRTNKDFRKGTEIKKELIQNILNKYFIELIVDDANPIVEMYRNLGFTVLQPNRTI